MKTPESDRGHQETGLPRVAVVAVHGVATHRPGESARKVADLLVGWKRPPGAGPATDAERQEKPPTQQYTPFLRQSLRIKVRPMELEAPGDAGDADACPDDIAFSRDLLRHHPAKAGADDVYETARFEGSRVGENGQKQATVHVYEMFYDDLAALRGGFRGVFGELYQLLFHLSDLGRDTLARARHCAAPGGEKRAWDLLLGLHRVAAFFLASALPVLSLLLLTLALSVLTVSVPAGFHPALVRGLPVAAVAVGAPFLGWNRWQRRGGGVGSRAWWGVLGAGLLAPMVTYLLAGYLLSRLDTYKALAGEAALFISGGVLAVLAEYGKRRPKALLLARAFLPFTLVAFGLGMAWTEPGATGVARAALWTSEILLLALGASWTLFAFTQLLARVAGLLFAWTRPTPEARNYADRVTYTAAISLLVTSPLLLLLTMAGWLLFGRALEPLVFDPVSEPSLWEMLLEPEPVKRPAPLTAMEYQPVFLSGNQVFFGRAADWLPAQEFLVRVFVAYALPLFPLLPTLGLTLGLLAWALFPSVHAETRTLFGAKDGDSAVARRGGTWLTHGWRLQRYAGELLIVFGGIILLLGPFAGLALSPSVTAQARAALQVVGGTLAASTVGLLALGRRLDALSSWFYPVLDAALDVDKHLRRYPADAPPRARAFARYASLLRYLVRRDGPDARGYDAVILVAHSQGSVLTADLLRLMMAERQAAGEGTPVEPSLAKLGGAGGIPVCLFTMGSPLRQLYAQRFPDLYAWARHREGRRAPEERVPQGARDPDPEALGVAVWANAYRSGDYVGRYLWCAEDEDPWDRPGMLPRVLAPNRMEMCIGPGGHLRYWDASAPEVAATLDALIDAFVPGGAPDAPRDGARSARPPFTDPTFVESLE